MFRIMLGICFLMPLVLSSQIDSTSQDSVSNMYPSLSLKKQWRLDDQPDDDKVFKIDKYKPIFVMVANYTDGVNTMPVSENPLNSASEPTDYINSELKFQISFKSLIWNDIGNSKISLWGAYTQSSRWQVFNVDLSRPFRETNYEPEFILLWPTPYKLFGLDLTYISAAFNHQSNGRSNPYSRSWNRITFEMGFQGKDFTLLLKPWIRLSEDSMEDNNPDILDTLGRGELVFLYMKNRFSVGFTGRHSLKFGDNNRGSLELSLGFKLKGDLSLQGLLFHGYGESLLDYNYKQTMLGFGIRFL